MKKSKVIELKLLIPYSIIAVLAFSLAGLVTGWNLREDMNSKVISEASLITDKLSKTSK